MEKNIKYYVEIESSESEKPYSLQSKYFDREFDAVMWYRDSFDYVDMDEINVSLMKATFNDDETLNEIIYCYDITAKYMLKKRY